MPTEVNPVFIPDELEPLFPARVVSGVQPSPFGIHLGNYFGAVVTHIRLQHEYPGDSFYLIADYHAFTAERDPEAIRTGTTCLALDYLAAGLDPDKSTLYRQSDVPQICELMWLLACITRKTRLDRAHAYQTATTRGELPSAGLFLYPALMAADILSLRGTDVPVGHDQQQHLEITREIARAFNGLWGSVFPVPYQRPTTTPLVLGIDGQKMSKSYQNTLPVFWDDSEAFEARVNHIVTESTALGEPTDPERSTVFSLYQLVAAPDKISEMRNGLADGSLGFAEAKRLLLDALDQYFAPLHEKRRELAGDGEYVTDVLREGARRVREEAEATLDIVRDRVGLSQYRRRLL